MFLSCGQRPQEREAARGIAAVLEQRGFVVYVAIEAQTILEINRGIIRELKNSDCYLFVNFRRERIGEEHRGSLFSNQELAIAYALGFERILVISQRGVLSEGMLRYIGINTETFEGFDDCCAVVDRAITRSGWTPEYCRRLRADGLRFSNEFIAYGNLAGRFLYVDIKNGRSDIAALECTARLAELGRKGKLLQASPIRSPLKASGRPGFSHTIFPNSHEAFDLLCVGAFRPPTPWPSDTALFQLNPREQEGVYLNSALDVVGAGRLPITKAVWTLRYEFYAIDFPVLSVRIELDSTNWAEPVAKIASQETVAP